VDFSGFGAGARPGNDRTVRKVSRVSWPPAPSVRVVAGKSEKDSEVSTPYFATINDEFCPAGSVRYGVAEFCYGLGASQ